MLSIGFREYFLSGGNIMDIGGFVLMLMLCFLRYIKGREISNDEYWREKSVMIEFFSALSLFTRGFLHLLAFDFTRSLIYLMRETLRDMVVFLWTLALTIFSFSLLSIILLDLDKEHEDHIKEDFIDKFFDTFMLVFLVGPAVEEGASGGGM